MLDDGWQKEGHCLQDMTWLWYSSTHSSCSYWYRVSSRLKLSMLRLWWRKGLKSLTSLWRPISSWGMLEERSCFQQFLMNQWVTPYPCTCWLLWVKPSVLQGKDKIKRHVGGMAMCWEEVEEVWMSIEKEQESVGHVTSMSCACIELSKHKLIKKYTHF